MVYGEKAKKEEKNNPLGGRACVAAFFDEITGKDFVCGGGSIG